MTNASAAVLTDSRAHQAKQVAATAMEASNASSQININLPTQGWGS